MSFLKALGSSVSPLWVLGALVALGLILLIPRRTRRFARRWLLIVTGLYFVLGLPVVANLIAGSLPPATKLVGDDDPIDALVVFDGDNRRGRLAAALQAIATRQPDSVHLLSDEWLADELAAAGNPRSTFDRDPTTTNTREQMDWVHRLVAERPSARVTIIASRLQAPRVAALATAAGLPVTILPSPIDEEPPTRGWQTWVPSYIALRTSRDALYEHVALRYYRGKGWVE